MEGDGIFDNFLVDVGNRDGDVFDTGGDGTGVADVDAGLAVLINCDGLACPGEVEKFCESKVERGFLGSRVRGKGLSVGGAGGEAALLFNFPINDNTMKKGEEARNGATRALLRAVVRVSE